MLFMAIIPSNPNRILIQRADKLGDTILILPVLAQLAHHFPHAKLDVLTSKIGAHFLKQIPWVNQVIGVDYTTIHHQSDLIQRLKNNQYDLYIALWDCKEIGKVAQQLQIPCRIGDQSSLLNRRLYTHGIIQGWANLARHQVEFNQDLLRPLGIRPQFKFVPIPINANALATIDIHLTPITHTTPHRILFFLGTGGTNYPIPSPVMMGALPLLLEQGVGVILAAEQPTDLPIQHPNLLNLTGKTSLTELVALIHRCDYYVGGDTGPTHIASFLQKPMVFFSSRKTNPPARWGSFSPHQRIIRKEYPCPYSCHQQCHPQTCFAYLTPSLLVQTIQDLIHDVAHHPPKTPQDIKLYHLSHTLRGLVIRGQVDPSILKQGIQSASQGPVPLVLVPFDQPLRIGNVGALMRLLVHYNINVIIGDVPWWVPIWLRIYYGVMNALIPPVIIPMSDWTSAPSDWIIPQAMLAWERAYPATPPQANG